MLSFSKMRLKFKQNRHTVIAIDRCVKYDRVMKYDNGLQLLTKEEIESAVKECLEIAAEGGEYILSMTKKHVTKKIMTRQCSHNFFPRFILNILIQS